MGIIDRITGRGRTPVQDTRSALERAQTTNDPGVVGGSLTKFVDTLLDAGIDGRGPFDPARQVADEALRASGGDAEKAIDAIVRKHITLAAGNGFLTSLGGFITMPVALPANVLGFYLVATRMTAAVAAIRGYDITNEQIRTAVLLSLVGGTARQARGLEVDLVREVGEHRGETDAPDIATAPAEARADRDAIRTLRRAGLALAGAFLRRAAEQAPLYAGGGLRAAIPATHESRASALPRSATHVSRDREKPTGTR